MSEHEPIVAILIPCRDEAAGIAATVRGMRAALPQGIIYVYDNNSTDETDAVARQAGAIVRGESLQGKGHVIRRMFADVEADVYVLADGDATYDPTSAPGMVDLLVRENLDMVVGKRLPSGARAFRHGHAAGNRFLTMLLAYLFGQGVNDVLSGYRVFSRRFVKSFPAVSAGFETETELTVHALTLKMPIAEVGSRYFSRAEGSVSKLKTYRDGVCILRMMLRLFKDERPVAFFGSIAMVLSTMSVGLAIPVFLTFFRTGLVPRIPTTILSASIMLLAFLSLLSGWMLEMIARGRRETKRLAYLQLPSVQNALEARSNGSPATATLPLERAG